MPKRLLGVRYPCFSWGRLSAALEADLDKPNVDEIVESQDLKLQEVKRSVFNGLSIPLRLTAEPPILLSTISELPSPPLMVSTHYNDSKQATIQEGGALEPPFADSTHLVSDADIDFSKPENLFLLEAPIDARKDHNMLKLACTIPKHTFMNRLLRSYPINRKRLAFIQRRPSGIRSVELIGNLIVTGKSGEPKEVSISCQVCGQKFARQYQFQRHILIHPDPENKKFLCQVCGKRFNRADHLNRHAILHSEVKVHKCLLCGEEFDRASHLDRHRRKQHPPAGQQPSQTPPSTPLMKSPVGLTPSSPGFDRLLTSPEAMDQQVSGNNLHLLAAVANPETQAVSGELELNENGNMGGARVLSEHTYQEEPGVEPDRPYPCEVCGRKFIRATHLRRHMRIHTGEKPFACHICGRRYARGDYLRAHIHAHRRDKIHKCKHCGEVFHDLTRFADHCRLVHKDMDDQFGNPMPPPECSPPPPSLSALLETTLTAEQPEEITVVPSMNNMEMESSVPITLVTLPEQEICNDDVSISIEENPSNEQHTLPTPNHTSMMSPDVQLLSSQNNPHLIVQNGQLQMADSSLNEGLAFNHSFLHKKNTPLSYMDSVTQYIYSDGNHHGNMTTIFPTPRPSSLVDRDSSS